VCLKFLKSFHFSKGKYNKERTIKRKNRKRAEIEEEFPDYVFEVCSFFFFNETISNLNLTNFYVACCKTDVDVEKHDSSASHYETGRTDYVSYWQKVSEHSRGVCQLWLARTIRWYYFSLVYTTIIIIMMINIITFVSYSSWKTYEIADSRDLGDNGFRKRQHCCNLGGNDENHCILLFCLHSTLTLLSYSL
jgi:hypothetical protein